MRDYQVDAIFDALDVAAKQHPIKALIDHIPDKAESTLRSELTRQPGYKLGLVTALQVMAHTGDLTALDAILKIFDRVAVPLPKGIEAMRESDWFSYAGQIAARTGEVLTVMSEAMADGKISKEERIQIKKEVYEARQVMAALWFKLKEHEG